MRTSLRRALASGVVSSVVLMASAVTAGEIIVSPEPDTADQSSANAESQKNRARAFRKNRLHPGGDQKNTTILIVPADEPEGMLAPGRNTNENAASENRQRAAESRKPDASRELLITPPSSQAGVDSATTTAEKAHENRVKARAYSHQKGDRPLGVGPDGIPYIDCGDAGSVSGRIGDDSRAGNIVTIIRDNRVVKARCL